MRSTLFAGITAVFLTSVANAADDPNIPVERKAAVQQAMKHHIDKHKVDGRYVIFDAVAGQLLRLELKKLHAGVVRKAEFYVSCADFTDSQGGIVDVDFLVGQVEDGLHVLEGVVHKAGGTKRPYHLEEMDLETDG